MTALAVFSPGLIVCALYILWGVTVLPITRMYEHYGRN